MYLRTLTVQHLRRIGRFTLDLVEDGKPRMWTVLIGQNGTAKTSLLQAVALAAAGSLQVNTLAGPVVKHLRDRRSDDPLVVDAEFGFTPTGLLSRYHPLLPQDTPTGEIVLRSRVELRAPGTTMAGQARYAAIPAGAPIESAGDPLDHARSVHAPLWFVAGYGVSRNLPDASITPRLDRPSIERMRPLFDPLAPLTSTSFANHFLKKDVEAGRKAGATSRMYGKVLNEIVRFGGRDLLPDIERVELRGQGGTKSATVLIESDRFDQRMGSTTRRMAGVALSHGYQSVVAWIADLVGHILLEAEADLPPREMEGLVLVDEIDLYLHPSWQATIIPALKRVFPKLQFIVTTHSPVVLSTLPPREIVRLGTHPETGDVIRVVPDPVTGELVDVANAPAAPQPDPRPMTGGELYRHWFELDRLTPNPRGEDIRRYELLAGDPYRADVEQKELERLLRTFESEGIEVPAPVEREEVP